SFYIHLREEVRMLPESIKISVDATDQFLWDTPDAISHIRFRMLRDIVDYPKFQEKLVLTAHHNAPLGITTITSKLYVLSEQEMKNLVQSIENKTRLGIKVS